MARSLRGIEIKTNDEEFFQYARVMIKIDWFGMRFFSFLSVIQYNNQTTIR